MMILAHLIYFIVSTLSYDCTCKKYLGKFLKKEEKKKLEAFKQLKKAVTFITFLLLVLDTV